MTPCFTLPFLFLSPKFVDQPPYAFDNLRYTAWRWLPNTFFYPFTPIRGHVCRFSDSSSWSV